MKNYNVLFLVATLLTINAACSEEELSPAAKLSDGNLITYYDEDHQPTGEFTIQMMDTAAVSDDYGFNVLLLSANQGELQPGTYHWNPATSTFTPEMFSILNIQKHLAPISDCGGFGELETVAIVDAKITIERIEPDLSLQQVVPSFVIYFEFVTLEESMSATYKGQLHIIDYIGIRPH